MPKSKKFARKENCNSTPYTPSRKEGGVGRLAVKIGVFGIDWLEVENFENNTRTPETAKR